MYYEEIKSGSLVRFQMSSIVCPERPQVLEKITSRLNLTGKVVQLSDAGNQQDFYAIVQVSGIASPLIIPVSRVELYRALSEDEACL